LADNATDTSDVENCQGKASCAVTIEATEDNTGAINGIATAYILGQIEGTTYEEPGIGTPYAKEFTPVQNNTVRILMPVDVRIYRNFKVAVFNESGQELDISVRIATGDIALAS
jgi:hypothetical protein